MKEYLVQGNSIIIVAALIILVIALITIACEVLIIYHGLNLIKEREKEGNNSIKAAEKAEAPITCKKVAILKQCVV